MRRFRCRFCIAILAGVVPVFGQTAEVEVEELVTTFVGPDNGAGPTWCYGAPLIVSTGQGVFASITETGENVPPLCNTRWQLWQRDRDAWRLVQQAPEYRQREPCPLGVWQGDALLLSVNPSLEPPGTKYGRCHPHVLAFDLNHPRRQPKMLTPIWGRAAHFTDHSYRGMGVDNAARELLLLNIDAATGFYRVAHYSRRNGWRECGTLSFPIRSCYPQVVLRQGAAHVLAIGDIVEPVEEWRKHKADVLKRDWDYVFRRLFYAETPEVTRTPFGDPVEIDSVEETAGHIRNLDLHVDREGIVRVLYLKQPIQHAFMRDRFFPGKPMESILMLARLEKGQVVEKVELMRGEHDAGAPVPVFARLHEVYGGALYVLWATHTAHPEGGVKINNGVARLGEAIRAEPLAMEHPMSIFFTNTTRGGSLPNWTVDMLGVGEAAREIRYARLRIHFDTPETKSRFGTLRKESRQ